MKIIAVESRWAYICGRAYIQNLQYYMSHVIQKRIKGKYIIGMKLYDSSFLTYCLVYYLHTDKNILLV